MFSEYAANLQENTHAEVKMRIAFLTYYIPQSHPDRKLRDSENLKSFEKNMSVREVLKHFNDQYSYHIETSQLIYRANYLTGFYMMGTLVDKGLKKCSDQTLRIFLKGPIWKN